MRQAGPARLLKRSIDVVAASAGLVATAPVLLGVATAIRLSMGKGVLFRQTRPGLHGKPFQVMKFRTMRNATDAEGRPLPDEARMTKVGAFLRASSLDELPQLWNVVRGDLSLVGPRPLLMQYLERYSPEQARRHEVMPGITGWAQINGRNAISWDEKFKLDTWYVENWSPWLDLKILVGTVGRVVKRSGIAKQGHATMPEFLGEESGKDA